MVFNKPNLSILLHVKDSTTRKVLILFLQEVQQDIVFRHAQLTVSRRREEQLPWIQAHVISAINRIHVLLEYQGVLLTLMH
jgi:Flp pilus assembly CpaF family ATPase